VVNVHYLPDQIIEHTASRAVPASSFPMSATRCSAPAARWSRRCLAGQEPFFHVNADTMWIDGVRPNLARLAETFDPERMDILLLMAPTTSSIGYGGRGDYAMLPDGALRKRREHQVVPFVYAGARSCRRRCFTMRPPAIFADENVRPRQ
jgi:hypothetical protein